MSVYIDLLLNSDFKEPTNNSREKTNVKHVLMKQLLMCSDFRIFAYKYELIFIKTSSYKYIYQYLR